ncbi:MAG TPA: YicC family protein [Planctomycetota bacterium]|nr:YicC family protein [Planctomycetota bacterium]
MAKRGPGKPGATDGGAAPLLSMTGFGSGSARTGGWRAEVEIRSVNGRYLSLKTHMAGEYSLHEEPLRALVEKRLVRGSVDLRADLLPERPEDALSLDESRVQAYVEAWRTLARKLKLPGEVTVESLASQPDFFASAGSRRQKEGAGAALLEAAAAAVDKLEDMRRREGAGLRADLESHLDAIAALREQVAARNPETIKGLVERAAERVRKLTEALPGSAPRQEDLARELAWWADRTDISEEMHRLGSHIAEFRSALAAGSPAGKRLEFLVQELHREANTSGSKAADTEVARLIVDMKSAIEKLREQVQNVL